MKEPFYVARKKGLVQFHQVIELTSETSLLVA